MGVAWVGNDDRDEIREQSKLEAEWSRPPLGTRPRRP